MARLPEQCWAVRTCGFALLAILCLSPLPFGSNRLFFEAALNGAVGALWLGLGLFWSFHPEKRRDSAVVFSRIPKLLLVWLVVGLWLCLQLAPIWPSSEIQISAAATLGISAPSLAPLTTNTTSTWFALQSFAALAGLFFLAYWVGQYPSWARRLVIGLAVSSCVYALYGLAEFARGNTHILWLEKWAYQDSLTATFVNRNAFAAYAGMGLLAMLMLVIRHMRRHAGHVSLKVLGATFIAALVLGAALLLSTSRMGLASTVVGAAAFLLSSGISHTLPSRLLIKMAIIGSVVLGSLAALFGSGLAARLDHATLAADERPEIWQATWALISERPMTGWGAGTFEAVFQQARTGKTDFTYNHAHSTYLEKALEWGIPLTCLAIVGLLLVGLQLLHGVRHRRQHAYYPALALAIGMQAALHAAVDFPFQMPANAAILSILLGLGVAQSFSSQEATIKAK